MSSVSLPANLRWYQIPAPPAVFSLAVAVVLLIPTYILYRQRTQRLSKKFAPEEYHGTLKLCTKISAYMDHYEAPGFAILRVSTKGFFFLAAYQYNYHLGFWFMIISLILESSLDTLRVLLAYWRCKRVGSLEVIADEEARDFRSTVATTLEPTNVYEDLTRPQMIGAMVFTTQVFLIGLVLRDSYQNVTRTCFDAIADHKCPMLGSMGSYALYMLGIFMSCVFFVGPGNSYGKKEQNSAFWLKLFLLMKEATESTAGILTLKWTNAATEQEQLLQVPTISALQISIIPFQIQTRYFMSYFINGAGFFILLHLLPLQVAAQNNGIGVVFRAVGMIYLVNLDDTSGNTMTLVQTQEEEDAIEEENAGNVTHRYGFLSTLRIFRKKESTGNLSSSETETTPLLR